MYRIIIRETEIKKDSIAARYSYLKQKFKEIEENEIEGYKIRTKFAAQYEQAEPDIAFYSKLEERNIARDSITQLAKEKDGQIYTDNKNITQIATEFCTDLYTPEKVNKKTQDRLLGNIKNKISREQKEKLDAPITIEELKTAIFQMLTGKTPGLDGIPIEFYQEFWEQIKEHYLAFINRVKTLAFPKSKNTSVIKLIFKKKEKSFFWLTIGQYL